MTDVLSKIWARRIILEFRGMKNKAEVKNGKPEMEDKTKIARDDDYVTVLFQFAYNGFLYHITFQGTSSRVCRSCTNYTINSCMTYAVSILYILVERVRSDLLVCSLPCQPQIYCVMLMMHP